MFPILLDLRQARVLLIGNGRAALRRLQLLDADGACHLRVFADDPLPELAAAAGQRLEHRLPAPDDIRGAQIVFAVDQPEKMLIEIAAMAAASGTLVNIEDRPALGNFHSPSQLRRGDLLITVSTNGTSPALARRLIRFLGGLFGPEWEGRMARLAELRRSWRQEGADPAEIIARTNDQVDREGWFSDLGPRAKRDRS